MGVVPFCWASGVFDGIQRVYRIAYTTKRKAAPPGRHEHIRPPLRSVFYYKDTAPGPWRPFCGQ